MEMGKRVIDVFDPSTNRKSIRLPSETVEYYSYSAGFGYGMGELQKNAYKFPLKIKPHKE